MVVKRETVITRLENLDRIVSELNQYAGLTYSQYSAELRHQWVICLLYTSPLGFNRCRCSSVAVSYTHLDVYKRQGL